jgi:hypothetical protein
MSLFFWEGNWAESPCSRDLSKSAHQLLESLHPLNLLLLSKLKDGKNRIHHASIDIHPTYRMLIKIALENLG